ncbi:hypothetical protein evm_014550 [Chilo suppressalis]|nr:hypothetical protein evm_014550 [Chilo suppressalis]
MSTGDWSLTDLDPSLPTYVMVATLSGKNEVFNIPVRPKDTSSSLYVGLGIGAGVVIACALAVVAVCIWRRRKRTGSPHRSRRRNITSNEDEDEEAAEMKTVGGRLANGGGSKDAGEPLLNGHVHITENPVKENITRKKSTRTRQQTGLEPAPFACSAWFFF